MSSIYDMFISFEWTRGLLTAQLLRTAFHTCTPPPRVWFALEQDAASPSAMASGVAASATFVFIATDGVLLKPNVRHEVACAIAGRKRVVVLLDAAGPALEAILAQAATCHIDPLEDLHCGRKHLSVEGLAVFAAAAAAAPRLTFHRDASLLQDTAPALLSLLELPLPAATPPPIPCGQGGALFVAGNGGELQALYLAEATRRAAGKELVCQTLLPGAGSAAAAAAMGQAGVLVLVLTAAAWDDADFTGVAAEALKTSKPVVLVHEADAGVGGAAFGDIMAATPSDLKAVYSRFGLAITLLRGAAEESILLEKLLARLKDAAARPYPTTGVSYAGLCRAISSVDWKAQNWDELLARLYVGPYAGPLGLDRSKPVVETLGMFMQCELGPSTVLALCGNDEPVQGIMDALGMYQGPEHFIYVPFLCDRSPPPPHNHLRAHVARHSTLVLPLSWSQSALVSGWPLRSARNLVYTALASATPGCRLDFACGAGSALELLATDFDCAWRLCSDCIEFPADTNGYYNAILAELFPAKSEDGGMAELFEAVKLRVQGEVHTWLCKLAEAGCSELDEEGWATQNLPLNLSRLLLLPVPFTSKGEAAPVLARRVRAAELCQRAFDARLAVWSASQSLEPAAAQRAFARALLAASCLAAAKSTPADSGGGARAWEAALAAFAPTLVEASMPQLGAALPPPLFPLPPQNYPPPRAASATDVGLAALAEDLLAGNVVLCLGSDFFLPAQLPNKRQFFHECLHRVRQYQQCLSDFETRRLEDGIEAGFYDQVAQRLEDIMGKEFQQFALSQMAYSEPLHRRSMKQFISLLRLLPFRSIVTPHFARVFKGVDFTLDPYDLSLPAANLSDFFSAQPFRHLTGQSLAVASGRDEQLIRCASDNSRNERYALPPLDLRFDAPVLHLHGTMTPTLTRRHLRELLYRVPILPSTVRVLSATSRFLFWGYSREDEYFAEALRDTHAMLQVQARSAQQPIVLGYVLEVHPSGAAPNASSIDYQLRQQGLHVISTERPTELLWRLASAASPQLAFARSFFGARVLALVSQGSVQQSGIDFESTALALASLAFAAVAEDIWSAKEASDAHARSVRQFRVARDEYTMLLAALRALGSCDAGSVVRPVQRLLLPHGGELVVCFSLPDAVQVRGGATWDALVVDWDAEARHVDGGALCALRSTSTPALTYGLGGARERAAARGLGYIDMCTTQDGLLEALCGLLREKPVSAAEEG